MHAEVMETYSGYAGFALAASDAALEVVEVSEEATAGEASPGVETEFAAPIFVSHGAALSQSGAHQTGLPTDETALIRAAQAGNQDAFGALVRAYDQSVLKLAMNILRSPDDAQDVYQEAFLRVYKNLDKFRFDCSFHTWLYRIVTNLCLDQMRKRKVRREEPDVVVTSEGPVDRMDGVQEKRADGDPSRSLFSGELRRKMKEALQDLTPRERMVFELRHFQGLRLRRIGEILETSEEAAKNCLFRANQKMRAALGDFV